MTQSYSSAEYSVAQDPLHRLISEGLSVLVFRDDQDLYSSTLTGVRPLLELLDWFPAGLSGAVVADRVVGACAARIFAHLRPREVLALKGSIEAERILFSANVSYRFHETVPYILNRDNTGPCPFETLSAEHKDISTLIVAMHAKLAQMQSKQ